MPAAKAGTHLKRLKNNYGQAEDQVDDDQEKFTLSNFIWFFRASLDAIQGMTTHQGTDKK